MAVYLYKHALRFSVDGLQFTHQAIAGKWPVDILCSFSCRSCRGQPSGRDSSPVSLRV